MEIKKKVDTDKYIKPSDDDIKKRLTKEQYDVTQNNHTEPPFKNEFWLITGCAIALISFVLILIGMTNLNPGRIGAQNIFAYIVFSLILGVITAVLQHFMLDIPLLFFIGGIGIGFFQMFLSFVDKSNGWADLAGIANLMTSIVMGLVAGILAQAYIWLMRKIKKDK